MARITKSYFFFRILIIKYYGFSKIKLSVKKGGGGNKTSRPNSGGGGGSGGTSRDFMLDEKYRTSDGVATAHCIYTRIVRPQRLLFSELEIFNLGDV